MNVSRFLLSRPWSTVITLSFLALFSSLASADYEKGMDAYLNGNYKIALQHFKNSAKEGNAKAIFHIGNMYENGEGVKKSKSKAFKWFQKSAEKGYANAQYNVGVTFYSGEEVKKSHKKAVKWWKKAARQGIDSAQLNLGIAYAKGEGVDMDLIKSYMWASIASAHGNNQSRSFMNQLVTVMTLKQLNEAERLSNQWLDKYQ